MYIYMYINTPNSAQANTFISLFLFFILFHTWAPQYGSERPRTFSNISAILELAEVGEGEKGGEEKRRRRKTMKCNIDCCVESSEITLQAVIQ